MQCIAVYLYLNNVPKFGAIFVVTLLRYDIREGAIGMCEVPMKLVPAVFSILEKASE